MNRKIKISIIIPAFNAEKYIEKCLDSIITQTLKDIEIIVIDDGSIDETKKILEKYSSVRIITHTKNEGLAKSRHDGLLYAKGEYIAFVDADDYVSNTMYEELYSYAIKNKSDFCYCDYDFFPDNDEYKKKWFKEISNNEITWKEIERNTQPWNKIVKKELFERTNAIELMNFFGDSIYVKLLIYAKKPISYSKQLYHYRVGHNSMSGGYKNKIELYKYNVKKTKKQKDFIKKTKYENVLNEYFDYRYIYSLLQLCIVSAFNKNKKNLY